MAFTKHGTPAVPFTELLADTICVHGIEWTRKRYLKRGMPQWEWDFWMHALAY